MEQKKLWNILGLNPRILIYCNKTIFFWVKHFFLLFEIKSFKYTQDKLYISNIRNFSINSNFNMRNCLAAKTK